MMRKQKANNPRAKQNFKAKALEKVIIENRIREITMQEIVIIHMTDIVKGKEDLRNQVFPGI